MDLELRRRACYKDKSAAQIVRTCTYRDWQLPGNQTNVQTFCCSEQQNVPACVWFSGSHATACGVHISVMTVILVRDESISNPKKEIISVWLRNGVNHWRLSLHTGTVNFPNPFCRDWCMKSCVKLNGPPRFYVWRTRLGFEYTTLTIQSISHSSWSWRQCPCHSMVVYLWSLVCRRKYLHSKSQQSSFQPRQCANRVLSVAIPWCIFASTSSQIR